MNDLGIEDSRVDYVVVDSLRVPRQTFATIIQAWRDGYSEVIAQNSKLGEAEVRALFDQSISAILDPRQYAVWHIPIISGRKPA
jgi:hypothetical protein